MSPGYYIYWIDEDCEYEPSVVSTAVRHAEDAKNLYNEHTSTELEDETLLGCASLTHYIPEQRCRNKPQQKASTYG